MQLSFRMCHSCVSTYPSACSEAARHQGSCRVLKCIVAFHLCIIMPEAPRTFNNLRWNAPAASGHFTVEGNTAELPDLAQLKWFVTLLLVLGWPFQVRLELRHRGRLDMAVTVTASVINDAQYSKPGSWQPVTISGQPDLEGHSMTRQIQAGCCCAALCCAVPCCVVPCCAVLCCDCMSIGT